MSYNSDFERAFIERSLELVKQYNGPFDATLLLNCLLGLLLVPKETCLEQIPTDPIDKIKKWGIPRDAIKSLGKYKNPDSNPETLRGLVWRLRNAIAHFRFKPIPEKGEVTSFHFNDENGFEAEIKVEDLKVFVEKLAQEIKDM